MDAIKDNENAWSPVWIRWLGIVPVVVIGVVAIAASIETSMRVHSEVERSFGEKVVDQEKMRAYAECIKIRHCQPILDRQWLTLCMRLIEERGIAGLLRESGSLNPSLSL